MLVSQAQGHLTNLEELCSTAAAFLRAEADKFDSDAANVDTDLEFIELGLEVAIEDSIPILEQRGKAFEKFYQIMDSICSNYKAVVRPQSYPPIKLPLVNLTLY